MSVTEDAKFMELFTDLKHKSFAYEQSSPGDRVSQEIMNRAGDALSDYLVSSRPWSEEVEAFKLAVGHFTVACWQYIYARDDCSERLDIDTRDLEKAEQEVIQRANELRR